MFELSADAFIDFYALQGHKYTIKAVAFSPNGKLLVSSSADLTMRLWSVEERKTNHVFESSDSSHIIFLRDSLLVASQEDYRISVKVWDTETGEMKYTFTCEFEGYICTAQTCSPDARWVAAGLSNNRGSYHPLDRYWIALWDTEKRERRYLVPYDTQVHSITFSSNGESMVLRSLEGPVKWWNTRNTTEEHILGDSKSIERVAFSPNNQFIALEGAKTIWVWDKEKEKVVSVYSDLSTKGFGRMIFSPNGKLAMAGVPIDEGEIKIYEARQPEKPRVLRGHWGNVSLMAFSQDSRLFASASADRTVRLWDVEKGKELSTLQVHSSIGDVTFSPNGEFVAAASEDEMVGLWNVSQWKK